MAKVWFDEFESAGCDGIIAKDPESTYQSGKRAMIRSHRRTIDVVGWLPRAQGRREDRRCPRSLQPNGDLTSSVTAQASDTDRGDLPAIPELAIDSSFGEAAAPRVPSAAGAPARQVLDPVQPGVVIEVSYDQLEAISSGARGSTLETR